MHPEMTGMVPRTHARANALARKRSCEVWGSMSYVPSGRAGRGPIETDSVIPVSDTSDSFAAAVGRQLPCAGGGFGVLISVIASKCDECYPSLTGFRARDISSPARA